MVKWSDNTHIMVGWSNRAQTRVILTLCDITTMDCRTVRTLSKDARHTHPHMCDVTIYRVLCSLLLWPLSVALCLHQYTHQYGPLTELVIMQGDHTTIQYVFINMDHVRLLIHIQ